MRAIAASFLWLLMSVAVDADKHDEPVLIDASIPRYPRLAEMAHLTGEVRAEFRVSSNGEVSDIKTSTGHPSLQSGTQKNIQSWKFSRLAPGKTSMALETVFIYKLAEGCVEDNLKDQTVTITLKSFRHVEIQIVPECPERYTSPLK
jgi:TonB family protein